MTITTRTHILERLGRWLGKGLRVYARGERWVHNVLVKQGTSDTAATTLLWVVKLTVLAMLLYTAFWITILALFAIAAAWLISNNARSNARK